MEDFSSPSADGQGIYGFPRHDVPVTTKLGKDWNIQYCQAIHYLYRNGLAGINFSDVDLFARYRRYGAGNQDAYQYMERLGMNRPNVPALPNQLTTAQGELGPDRQNSDFARKGFMNLNWEILSVAPNFLNIVLGMFEEVEHDIYADGVDEKSSTERESMKWNLWVEKQLQNYAIQMEQAAQINLPKSNYIPETIQELEMFSNLGGFKLKSEISIEAALKYTMDISEWKEIKRKVIKDLYELGVGATKDYLDPETQKVKVRYCDPALMVLPYTNQDEFTNMPFCGEYTFYTIAQLRAMTNEDGSPTFTNDELEIIARSVLNQFQNPQSFSNWTIDPATGWYLWDNFRVCVLDAEFKSDDIKYMTERVTEDGEVVVHEDTFGKVRNSDKRKTHKTKTLMVYKCKWIVGTKYAWDYGHQFNIPRPTPSQANLSFHAYRMKAGSYVKRMIPMLDSIQLAWLKLQNIMATAAPPGLAIETGVLDNITIGGQKINTLDILRIRGLTGNILYKIGTHRSYQPTATNYKPIQELQGGFGAQLQELYMIINNNIEMIRQIIGINRVADGSSPQTDQLVGVTELSMQAAQNTLKPLYYSYLQIKERACKNIAQRIQLIVKHNGMYELGYFKALGKNITETLKIGAEINNAMFGIRIEARPDAAEKQVILQAAQQAMAVGRQGVPLITMSDFLMINTFLQRGMLKFAQAYLAHKEQQTLAQQQQQQQQAIEAQGQQNMMLEQAKAQAAQQALQLQMQLIAMENEEKRKTEYLKGQMKLQEIRLEKGMELENDVIIQSMINKQDTKELETYEVIEEKKIEASKQKPTTPKK